MFTPVYFCFLCVVQPTILNTSFLRVGLLFFFYLHDISLVRSFVQVPFDFLQGGVLAFIVKDCETPLCTCKVILGNTKSTVSVYEY